MLIKLVRGKCINGVDYGPGYPEDVVDVDPRIARAYLASGAAVLVVAQELPPVATLSSDTIGITVESRDPRPSSRRGRK
jgi:hypothetical protein